MADVVDDFERWHNDGQEMVARLEARRTVVLAEIDERNRELDRLNQALMKLGARAVSMRRTRSKGRGSITPNRRGWRWRVSRDGRTYVSKTIRDREAVELSLKAALEALDHGEEPRLDLVRVTTTDDAPQQDEAPEAPAPTPEPRPAPTRKPRKPSAPDPDRIRLIAASAERSGGPMPTEAAGDLQAITRGIAKLPNRLANVARRHWLRGQKAELIARELQVTVKAVEEMLVEARQLAIAAVAA